MSSLKNIFTFPPNIFLKLLKTSNHEGGTIEKCLKITQKHSKTIVLFNVRWSSFFKTTILLYFGVFWSTFQRDPLQVLTVPAALKIFFEGNVQIFFKLGISSVRLRY